jgi:replicative superfamily II helicase
MIYDFEKRLGQKSSAPVTDPVALYDTLDRESDKGPLRDPQKAVLRKWYDSRRTDRDLILKLHTGQGKTLVGLLILQSQLNSGLGPALYLCPNHSLVNQTCKQARQFGITVVQYNDELPNEFLDGKAILVAVVHALFNGATKFKLDSKSQPVGTLLLDDAHACVDIVRDQFTIRIQHDQAAYRALRDLFAVDLEDQGAGTFAELVRNKYDAILPVPYWSWREKLREVTSILADQRESKAVRFTWPILKDSLENCTCVFSGQQLEISPTLPPLNVFGSYAKARHRVFMSATVANDAFLIKGFGMRKRLRIRFSTRRPSTYNAPACFACATNNGNGFGSIFPRNTSPKGA